MVILQITTLDEFHECVVQAMFHFPALAALSIILASIVCIIIVAYKYKTKQIAKDEAVRYTGIIYSFTFMDGSIQRQGIVITKNKDIQEGDQVQIYNIGYQLYFGNKRFIS